MRSLPTPPFRAPLTAALLAASLLIASCGDETPQAAAPTAAPTTTDTASAAATPEPTAEPKEAASDTADDAPADRAPADDPAEAADESIADNTDPSAPAGTADSAPGVGDAQVPIVTTDQDPVTITVAAGDLVAFRAVSGTDERVRVQGRSTDYPVSAGVSRIIRFTAKKPGKYAITFDEMGRLVGTLVVTG